MVGALRLPTLQDVGEGGGCAALTHPTGCWRGWWVPTLQDVGEGGGCAALTHPTGVGEGGGCASLTHPTERWRGWWVRCAYPPYRMLARVVDALRLPTLHKTVNLCRRAGKRSAPAEPRTKRRPLTTPYAGRNTRNECSLYSRPGSLTAPRRTA